MRNKAQILAIVLWFAMGIFTSATASSSAVETRVNSLVDECLVSIWGEGMVTWEPGSNWRLNGISPSSSLEVVARTDKPRGTTVLILQVLENAEVRRRIPLSVRVYAFDHVPVITREISTHELISPADIHWRRMEVTTVAGEWIEGMGELQSDVYWARRPLRENDVLTLDKYEPRPEVVRGDMVDLVSIQGRVTINLPGIALQNGSLGDRIRVENTTNGALLRGIVNGDGLVQVEGVVSRRRGSR